MIDLRFSTSDLCRIALVTARQLQWWDEQGILIPEQESGKRLYSPHLAMCAMLYRELEERGLKLQAFRRVIRAITIQDVKLPDESKRWLLTDGERVIFLLHHDVVLAFMEQRRNPLFALIPLEPLSGRLQLAAAELELPARKPPEMETVSAPGVKRMAAG